ncbi:MAG: HEAT repeat domain-containing protein [Verrucomicrobiota bacterium]
MNPDHRSLHAISLPASTGRVRLWLTWVSWALLGCLPGLRAAVDATQVEPGFALKRVLDYGDLHAFTWDERGRLWIASGSDHRLILSSATATDGTVHPAGSVARKGNDRTSLLVNAGQAFVSDGAVIRVFRLSPGPRLEEESTLVLPDHLFPEHSRVTSLHWAPLGDIWFSYRSAITSERGVGRVHPDTGRWDIVSIGLFGDFTFDPAGLPVAADAQTAAVFRLAMGMDYEGGLANYTKRDLALPSDRPAAQPAALAIYSGSAWPQTNRDTWLIYDSKAAVLQQFREEGGRLSYRRDLAHFPPATTISDLQVGPDGDVWMIGNRPLPTPVDDPGRSSLLRLANSEGSRAQPPVADFSGLKTTEAIDALKTPNSWQREAALRILERRDDLRHARGLHPGTALHDLFANQAAGPLPRLYSLFALHRVHLLDENLLESASEDPEPIVRIWAALLFGERNYPTGLAFQRLVKMVDDTNMTVRSAVAIAARQFVSGSMAIDTAPRSIPLREVFTGGILSGLWFSTDHGSTPEFDLLFWNAVRPIAAFDSAHPLGFFNMDKDEGSPIAYWMIGLITQIVAEMDDPLKQEDAMRVLAKLKPANHRLILAALQGLKKGTPRRKVQPAAGTREVLEFYARNENGSIAALAQELLNAWLRPFRQPPD